MRMQRSWKRVVMASMLMLAVGCRTPVAGLRAAGASDSGNASDSGASSNGDSSKSDSGNSSGGDSSKSGSGDSSGGDSASSRSESSGTSEEGTSHSDSSDTSDSTGSDTGDSSESGSGSEEGDSSRSESNSSGSSDNSSGSSDDSSGSSDNGSSKSSQVDPGEEASSRSESSNGKDNRLLSTAAVALTVLGLGVVIWQVYEHSERGREFQPSPQEVGHAAQVYLRARTHQLREDLALGAGPTVEDLAQAARIRRENLDVFGRLLRTHPPERFSSMATWDQLR